MTTTVKVGDPDPTDDLDTISGYCFAPYWLAEKGRFAYCCWKVDHDQEQHVSADVAPPLVVAVWTGDALPQGRVWAPRQRRPWVLGPEAMGLTADAWTDAMAIEGRATGVNRQCSIGWHDECSDPAGEQCKCACHGASA